MHPEFWKKRWAEKQIGFHQSAVEPKLATYFPRLNLPPHSTVLVPLCGKSLDLLWLARQGYNVIGAELSSLACEEFFKDNQIPCQTREPRIHKSTDPTLKITLFEGDFFTLKPEDFGVAVSAFYDRAALIALPPEMRARYVTHLLSLLGGQAKGLLITLNRLDPAAPLSEGPPFSVPDDEVLRLYQDRFGVTRLEQTESQIREDRAHEAAWLLEPR